MACRTALRSVLLIEPWRPVHLNRVSVCASFRTRGSPAPRLSGKLRTIKGRDFHHARRTRLSCSHNENAPSSSSQDEQGPPQEVVLKAISGFAYTHYLKMVFFFFLNM